MSEQTENTQKIEIINDQVKSLIETEFGDHKFWMKGIVSGYNLAPSGISYFKLRDGKMLIPCIVYRYERKNISFSIQNGHEIEIFGQVNVWKEECVVQFKVKKAKLISEPRKEKMNEITQQLSKDGILPNQHKDKPKRIKRVALISGRNTAGKGDVRKIFQRQLGDETSVEIKFYEAPMEGRRSASQVVHHIEQINQNHEADVIAIVRGGGKSEFETFDDPLVVNAIARSKIYIVTGIGHSMNETIADNYSDFSGIIPTDVAYHIADLSSPKKTKVPRLVWVIIVVLFLVILALVVLLLTR